MLADIGSMRTAASLRSLIRLCLCKSLHERERELVFSILLEASSHGDAKLRAAAACAYGYVGEQQCQVSYYAHLRRPPVYSPLKLLSLQLRLCFMAREDENDVRSSAARALMRLSQRGIRLSLTVSRPQSLPLCLIWLCICCMWWRRCIRLHA